MSVRKFIAPTSREALREVRQALGDDAVVLASRSVENGVEITAVAQEALAQLAPPAHADGPQAARPRSMGGRSARSPAAGVGVARQAPQASLGVPEQDPCNDAWGRHLMSEIHALRGALEGQIAGLAWTEHQRRDPVRTQLLRDFLTSGFTPALARTITDAMPGDRVNASGAVQWAQAVLGRNLSVAQEDACVVRGGIYALVGPTGAGKTTTTAKLAARCVVRHGADRLALLTTDSYRVGGHDQLRVYGKILGVPAHVVRDADDLHVRLAELKNKHMVLIDTMGMSQRDEQVPEQLAMLDACGVQRLVLLAATAGAAQLEDVVRAYRGKQLHGAIITKTDEAVGLAGALDVVLRHKLILHYVANGQRVPEDLHPAQPALLARAALRPSDADAGIGFTDAELPLLAGAFHAARAPAAGASHA